MKIAMALLLEALLLLRQKASSLILSSQRDVRLRHIALGDTAF